MPRINFHDHKYCSENKKKTPILIINGVLFMETYSEKSDGEIFSLTFICETVRQFARRPNETVNQRCLIIKFNLALI